MPQSVDLDRTADADHAVEQRCRAYQTLYGLNAFRDETLGAIRVETGPVTAVMAPKHLAAPARTLLDAPSIPVFSFGTTIWVFLTDGLSPGEDTDRLSIEMFRTQAIPILPPAHLALPTPGNSKRCWLYSPNGPTLPSITAVATALLTAATQTRPH